MYVYEPVFSHKNGVGEGTGVDSFLSLCGPGAECQLLPVFFLLLTSRGALQSDKYVIA